MHHVTQHSVHRQCCVVRTSGPECSIRIQTYIKRVSFVGFRKSFFVPCQGWEQGFLPAVYTFGRVWGFLAPLHLLMSWWQARKIKCINLSVGSLKKTENISFDYLVWLTVEKAALVTVPGDTRKPNSFTLGGLLRGWTCAMKPELSARPEDG